jgi:ABC-type sugar transport system substrate-binding protein
VTRFTLPTFSSTKLTAGLAAGLSVLAMSACSSGTPGTTPSAAEPTENEGPYTIGFSPMNQSAPALVGLTKGLQGMAEGNEDIEEVLVADPNNDAATQVQQVTAWIDNKQVDAIWFLAVNAEAMAPVVERAEAAGVPVIALGLPDAYGYDAPAPGVSFSTIDYEAYGTSLGENVANCINDRLGGQGEVVFLQDPAGAVGRSEIQEIITDGVDAFLRAYR